MEVVSQPIIELLLDTSDLEFKKEKWKYYSPSRTEQSTKKGDYRKVFPDNFGCGKDIIMNAVVCGWFAVTDLRIELILEMFTEHLESIEI